MTCYQLMLSLPTMPCQQRVLFSMHTCSLVGGTLLKVLIYTYVCPIENIVERKPRENAV